MDGLWCIKSHDSKKAPVCAKGYSYTMDLDRANVTTSNEIEADRHSHCSPMAGGRGTNLRGQFQDLVYACILVHSLDEFVYYSAYGFSSAFCLEPYFLVVGFAEVNGDTYSCICMF